MEKTQKRTVSLVYLNHKALCLDMIIKAFNNYILSIYLYHSTIIMQFLQDEKKDDIAIRISNSMEKKTNAGKIYYFH